MRVEFEAPHWQLKATMIYVTHDRVEAMTMAEKIVVLNRGRIEQVGTPMELYNHPRTEFVAGFIGAPSMNIIDIEAGSGKVVHAGQALGIDAVVKTARRLGIGPEHIGIAKAGASTIDGTITLRETLGGDAYLYARTDQGQMLVVRTEGDTHLDSGERIGLVFPAQRLHFFNQDAMAVTAHGTSA
jgi:ABC-type sugar transport system ATPase subunit